MLVFRNFLICLALLSPIAFITTVLGSDGLGLETMPY
jgi:hypothetical protein